MRASKFEKFLEKQFLKRLAAANLEIEQKYRVKNVHGIRRALRELGALKVLAGQEHNELYDNDEKLKKNKQMLRLRYHGTQHAWLTFKGPRLKGKHKQRIEIETPVSFEEARRILLILGFRMISSYRKYRESYKVRSVKVFLDYLPRIGWFVEIEGLPEAIQAMAKKLGLDSAYHEDRSYRKILAEASARF
jgi:predicted adenylyl cyclase CyaB